MGAGTERADKYAHDDASACYSEVYGRAHSRQVDGNHAERKTQYHPEEDGSEVGLFEHLDSVSEELLGVTDVFRRSHNGEAVAVLKAKVVAGKQLYVAAHYPADVHSVCRAHVERAERLAVELCPGEQNHAALPVAVYGVPVYTVFVAVPVFLHLLAEEYAHCLRLVYLSHHEHAVALLHRGLRQRHNHLSVAPYARYDEVAVGHLRYLKDGFPVERGVHDDVLCYVCVVLTVLLARLKVCRLDEETAYEHHGEYHSDNSERIGHGASQCRSVARKSCAVECLLRCGKGGGVGCRSAKDAGHVRNAYSCQRTEYERQYRSGCDDSHAPYVERQTLVPHHADKARSDVQSEGVDEEQKPERLCETHHHGVGTEA